MLKFLRVAALVPWCWAGAVSAQTTERILSLRAGETADVGTAFFIVNCRSILKGEPVVEIMESPPDVTVTLRKEKIVPRTNNCSRPVEGGTLVVTAPKDVKARTEGKLTIRVDYLTLDGKRQSTREFNLVLFPAGAANSGSQATGDQKP